MVHQSREERLAKQRKYFKEYYKTFYNTPKDYNGVMMTYSQNYYLTNKEYLNEYQREYNAKKRNQIKPPISKAKTPTVPKVTSKLLRKRNDIEKQLKEMADKAAAFKSSLENSG